MITFEDHAKTVGYPFWESEQPKAGVKTEKKGIESCSMMLTSRL